MFMLRRRAPKGPHIHTQAYKHEPRPRNHETSNARKVQEDRDEVKEQHGMKKKQTGGDEWVLPTP